MLLCCAEFELGFNDSLKVNEAQKKSQKKQTNETFHGF